MRLLHGWSSNVYLRHIFARAHQLSCKPAGQRSQSTRGQFYLRGVLLPHIQRNLTVMPSILKADSISLTARKFVGHDCGDYVTRI